MFEISSGQISKVHLLFYKLVLTKSDVPLLSEVKQWIPCPPPPPPPSSSPPLLPSPPPLVI